MLSSRIFWKLYAAFVALVLVSAVTSLVLVERSVERDEKRQIESSLSSRLALLQDIAAGVLKERSYDALRARMHALGQETGARLTVIDAQGVVVADSEEQAERMDNHLDRPEIQQALTTGAEGEAVRFSATLRSTLVYRARQVRSADHELLGFVRASLPQTELEARLAHLRGMALIGGAVGALAGLIVAWMVARRVTGPIDSMMELATSIARGDYSRKLEIASFDELGELGISLNHMSNELRQRMETIVSDRNKLLAILGSMVEGVVAVDRDDRVVHMNEVAGRLLRASPAESLGKRIWEVTRVVEVCEMLEHARQRVGGTDAEVHLAMSNGEARIELRASPLVDGAGALSGAVVVLHDVTDLRRLEGMRRDFVANVSHELKTPLTAIRGLVETLIEDPQMEHGTRERFHAKIRDQSARLTSLVSDLLTLARVESQSPTSERKPLDLRATLRECEARFAPLCEQQGLLLEVRTAPEPLVVEGDEESLRQIVDNLLDNALKYTPAKGRIVVSALPRGREAILEVSDTGIGIEPRDLERIFERFYRVDKARSRELGGTGLGLSIVKHLALSLGGNVAVESQVGRGSTFRIVLPRREAD
jgi:two-component system phosphate regulon sensor histidine kinase PhoR